ncbi:fumarylacetoacetate hydrolase family protein [Microbacterium sp. CFH 90308]|uniref:Fumarylacetoacetate hydrolase family protein n=1 Tax=Microbacterium salsuginis TaxID=2722803 RepID=A0ABX1KD90_9MICO|nr:fumarylacetoacetate hydrolase family protein [Microbacterium sp. CFH 90308]NLP84039.1 fumarylacetoacetate hydrolase family protein [Microbacterium sp. CFH 90308]
MDAAPPSSTEAPSDPRFAALLGRPGKIIAIHLSYASRADQRGRRPQHPSYFFKPSSSVAASGSTIERPAGTELLAFEGEIALVIGAPARRVPLAAAWSHVAAVTAANDFGLYDLRANDKGSNVRSKGRDGYTPIGPALIDARAVDPTALHLRTWRNGELVQDDTSAGMIFPLAQLVADLSQHFTLEPGDVILTGTPSGSSVAVPGDVIEVEVSVDGGPTTGRLVTSVVQSEDGFDPELGSLPAADDLQRTEAWGSPEAVPVVERGSAATETERAEDASGVSSRFARSTTEAGGSAAAESALSTALRAKLEAAPVAGLSAQLRKRGLNNVHIDGVSPLRPAAQNGAPLNGAAKLVGTARTLRFVPNREDLFASHGGGYNAQKRAFDAVGEGEVLVIEARGETGSGTLGDVLAIRAHARGAAGIVTDGGVRDAAAVAAVGIPVYSTGVHPAVLGRKHVPWDADIAVACGGATVLPGDVVVGDADGVIVIPRAIAEEVADAALAQEDEDAWIAARVAEGHPVDGLFPMNAEWRARFDADRAGEESR